MYATVQFEWYDILVTTLALSCKKTFMVISRAIHGKWQKPLRDKLEAEQCEKKKRKKSLKKGKKSLFTHRSRLDEANIHTSQNYSP